MVSRCLSAAGIRFLVILCPPGRSASLTVSPPATTLTARLDPGGVSTFRTHELRPGWVPSLLRGRWCSPRPEAITGQRPPHHSGLPLDPATTFHLAGFRLTKHQPRVHTNSPGKPGALLRRAPLRTVTSGFHRTRLKQAATTSAETTSPYALLASFGPFTTAMSRRLTYPSVPGSSSSSSSAAHLTASAPFRVRALTSRIRPVMRNGRLEGPAVRVPVSCCLSTAGLRFSIIRFPPGGWAFLAVGLPDRIVRTLTGVTAFRTHEIRAGWVPPVSRGQRCSSRLSGLLNRRLPLRSGESLYSAPAFHQRS